MNIIKEILPYDLAMIVNEYWMLSREEVTVNMRDAHDELWWKSLLRNMRHVALTDPVFDDCIRLESDGSQYMTYNINTMQQSIFRYYDQLKIPRPDNSQLCWATDDSLHMRPVHPSHLSMIKMDGKPGKVTFL